MPNVTIYTRPYCGYCVRAKQLLAEKGVEFDEKDSGVDPSFRSEMIQRAKGRSTFPQIFIGETHVGGCDDLYALEHAGRLDALLAS
ncbi:glutaredoxin 3 [Consotaella salsifontis]|uniref:Glutaredoxin n=1 Tax=Consotaella salsifontis TaxID=1365950 RepID=A0A1T4QLM1_9HYPH|nr:glutaredoxin 3 [Consotaella salsifontis]SKA04605.1 glutaredoxin 3 [Consotaella salsifontis]